MAAAASQRVIVIDCAAAVDALTAAPATDQLRARLAEQELHAPALLDYEIVAALRGLVQGGHLSVPRAADALADYADLPVLRWPAADELRRRAFQLRGAVSAYDAAYVALAEALECPLLTRDRRLARSRGHAARVEVY
jgi:predicted nucleic acid-binding protein